MAMQLIETIEVGSGGAASIEFTSIPQDGVDLVLVLSARSDQATTATSATVNFNSDTGGNYTFIRLTGDGSSATSYTAAATAIYFTYSVTGSTATSNTFGNSSLYISNYTSSSAKSISQDGVNENNSTASRQTITAQSWSGTSAISTITLATFNNNFVQYSTASLYKIS